MPLSPPMACSTSGCPGRRQAGEACPVCGKGGKREYDKQRGTSTERGYGKDWEALAAMHLAEHPYCIRCEAMGRINGKRGRDGLRVDHIVPVRMAPERRLDETNLQTLCIDCDNHVKKPIENRCRTPEQVEREWAEHLDALRRESASV